MDRRFVGKRHHPQVTPIQLRTSCPESYSLPIILHLLSFRLKDNLDAHFCRQIWTLRQHLVGEVFSKGVVHEVYLFLPNDPKLSAWFGVAVIGKSVSLSWVW